MIALLEERPLAPVAALGHMMGDGGQDETSQAHHGKRLAGTKGPVNFGVIARVTVITAL
jgi:hypothetical protein